VIASASIAEGWGMTLTEAAACGTPAVATRITGHLDSVAHDKSGLLASSSREMVEQLTALLADHERRARLSEGARKHAAQFTWETCAYRTLESLADDARHRRRQARGRARR
jgi:glycosyltransferase involved in cell wall biosynthesis